MWSEAILADVEVSHAPAELYELTEFIDAVVVEVHADQTQLGESAFAHELFKEMPKGLLRHLTLIQMQLLQAVP